MSSYGVDVRTPIFYRQSFASALETQSSKVYARLTHTPVIAEHLPRGASSAARIAQYGASRIHSIDDLEKLLRIVLEETAADTAAHTLNASTRDPGIEELERTVLYPASIARAQASRRDPKDKGGIGGSRAVSAAENDFVTAVSGLGSSMAARRVPPSVSFHFDSNVATPHLGREPTTFDHSPQPPGRAAAVWQRVRRAFGRGDADTALPSSPPHRPREEAAANISSSGKGGGAAPPTRPPRREHAASVQREVQSSVPAWVRAAFTPAAAATAAATINNPSASLPCGRRGSTSRETCAGPEDSQEFARQDTAVTPEDASQLYCATGNGNEDARQAQSGAALRASGPLGVDDSSGDRDGLDRRDSDPSPYLPLQPQNSSFLTPAGNTDLSLSERQRTHSALAQPGSAEDTLHAAGSADMQQNGSSTSPPASGARTNANTSLVGKRETAALRSSDEILSASDTGSPPPVSRTMPQQRQQQQRSVTIDGQVDEYDKNAGREGSAEAAVFASRHPHDRPDAEPQYSGGAAGGAASNEQPRLTTQPSTLSHTTAATATNVLARWDRGAYAVELVGWLHLLVWIRSQVILYLRELSEVQGFVAWSAWYWSWAQEHPRQATVHQALSSRRFWRGVWAHGLSAQVSEVQYETSGHMFTLKSAFRLIVTYIGAAYTSLEQLNSALLQIQHACEMSASPMAAAAAAAAAASAASRPFAVPAALSAAAAVGGDGVSGVAAPDMNASVNRLYSLSRREFLTNQSSLFWIPAPNGVAVDEFSPLAPRPRENGNGEGSGPRHGGPAYRTAFDDAAERASLHDTTVLDAAEEAEATAALHVLDELRRAVWAMLQEQNAVLCSNGKLLGVFESNDHFGWPCDTAGGGDGRGDGGAATTQPGAAPPPPPFSAEDRAGFNSSTLGEASAGIDAMPPCDEPNHHHHHHHHNNNTHHHLKSPTRVALGDDMDGERPVTARDGAAALLQCVQHSRRLVQRLTVLVQRAHSPPTSRHWQRIVVAAAAIVPPFVWVYTKTPAELLTIGRQRYTLLQQLVKSYLLEPLAQLRESLFFVRPGVEDRRGLFERDAVSLSNIIRDFHEDMYPNMPMARLEEMRLRTLDRLRTGVADPEGLGLIDQQYRHSVRHPIWAVVFGDLPRIMLIQLSYQALEMNRVTNGIDEVLEGNDLNFKIMALMPVVAAGGVLVSWAVLRYRANYKPTRMRMRLLWRSLFRVISFAGSAHHQTSPPFLRGPTHHDGLLRGASARPYGTAGTAFAPARHHGRSGAGRLGRGTAAAALPVHDGEGTVSPGAAGAWQRRAGQRRNVTEVDPVGFTASSDDDGGDDSSLAASVNTRDGGASALQLNNYEQGMVLLLSHVIRSLASEYLRSYAYFHELMEDLSDLESIHSTRHQRLATLERMRATHTSLF